MRISELAGRTGVSPRLLRYYEEQGLIRPRRGRNGYREYDDSHLGTVRRIRALLATGVPTSVIARVLPCTAQDGEALVSTCPQILAEFNRERDRVDQRIEALRTSRERLDAIITAPVREV